MNLIYAVTIAFSIASVIVFWLPKSSYLDKLKIGGLSAPAILSLIGLVVVYAIYFIQFRGILGASPIASSSFLVILFIYYLQ
jgi:hypothetical protein